MAQKPAKTIMLRSIPSDIAEESRKYDEKGTYDPIITVKKVKYFKDKA